jgi:hypothetical protein
MTPLSPEERAQVIRGSPLRERYATPIDRESAYEKLKAKAQVIQKPTVAATPKQRSPKRSASGSGDVIGVAAKSAARAIGSELGREILRGVLGSLSGKK